MTTGTCPGRVFKLSAANREGEHKRKAPPKKQKTLRILKVKALRINFNDFFLSREEAAVIPVKPLCICK
jgi:hypothetical protein